MIPALPRRAIARALPTPVLVVALLAGGSVAATSPPDGSDPPDGPDGASTVVVLDEGKGDERYELQAPMVAGTVAHQVKTTTTAGTLTLTGSQSLDATVEAITTVEQTAEVTAVDPEGGYTIERTVDSYDFVVSEGPLDLADGFKADEELEPLVGVTLEQRYEASGQLVSIEPARGVTLTADQEAALDTLIDEGSDRTLLPDVAVGVGAVWVANRPGGPTAGGEARYELVSIADGLATIEVTFEGDPASLDSLLAPAFDDITGSFSGAGTLTTDIDNPLASTFDFTLAIDVTMTGAPGEMTMDATSTSSQVVTVE
jgi:hypothetical protein